MKNQRCHSACRIYFLCLVMPRGEKSFVNSLPIVLSIFLDLKEKKLVR
jgi:hypothetical protein